MPYENAIALKRAHSAIIIDAFKLIKFHDNGELLLFNLTEDIEEKNNLAGSHPAKTTTLEKALDAYLSKVKAPKWKPGITWKNKPVEENKLLPLVFKAFSYILLIENYRYCSLVKKLTNLNKF